MTPTGYKPFGILLVILLLEVQCHMEREKRSIFQRDTLTSQNNEKTTLYKRNAFEPDEDVKAMIALIDKAEMKNAAQYCDDRSRCKDFNVFKNVIKFGFKGFNENFKNYLQFVIYLQSSQTDKTSWTDSLFTLVYKLKSKDEWLHTAASFMIGHHLYDDSGLRKKYQSPRNKHAMLLRVFHDNSMPKPVKFLLDKRNPGAQLCGESGKYCLQHMNGDKTANLDYMARMVPFYDNLNSPMQTGDKHVFYYAETKDLKDGKNWYFDIPLKLSIVVARPTDNFYKYSSCPGANNCLSYQHLMLWDHEVGRVLKIGSEVNRIGIFYLEYLLSYEDKSEGKMILIKDPKNFEPNYFYICNKARPLGWFD